MTNDECRKNPERLMTKTVQFRWTVYPDQIEHRISTFFSPLGITSFVINNSSLNRHLLECATAEVLGNVTELSTRSVASDLLST